MAEEFLTKAMIDEYKSFKPKLNWGGLNKMLTEYFGKMYYSVEDVKKNYLVRTSLDDNQLVVDSDDIQAEDTIEWNLTIQAPSLLNETKKIISVNIRGNLGTIYYSFKDEINTSSSIDFLDFYFRELKDNKYEFDPIFVLDAGTSEEFSGFVALEKNPDITLTYKFDDDSTVKYTSEQISISKHDTKITIKPNISIIDPDPPIGGGGDDDGESTIADIYLRYDFSLLNKSYYSPSFEPVWYNTTENESTASSVEYTHALTTIGPDLAAIDKLLGKMDTKQSLYLWNSSSICGSAYTSLRPTANDKVFLTNGLNYQPEYKYVPTYDASTDRYVIKLFIKASSSSPL